MASISVNLRFEFLINLETVSKTPFSAGLSELATSSHPDVFAIPTWMTEEEASTIKGVEKFLEHG